ncbi:piggyBac transposable element-derived protein 4-like protein [Lates japonicus]|uniref:PiggyBac transposable element-derived protein 4-like protein n=1 Tax=Lates japonicus TaxID=270547 RepID=A0AAD3RH41_LATJO|nr:piggyBac transposable element-derived protein 4-like protein [Lates japonicus]
MKRRIYQKKKEGQETVTSSPEGEEEGEVEELEKEGGGGEEEEGEIPLVARETFQSRNGKITWSSASYETTTSQQQQQPSQQQPWPPGPTAYVDSNSQDIVSTFYLFLTPEIDKIILEETNYKDLRKYGRDDWRPMDEINLHAYVGLLILAGVYRSRGEATASLWDAEGRRVIFRAMMSLKVFHIYLKLVWFDDRETRAERRASDKLAAVRKVWDNPGPHVTVDKQLVPFRVYTKQACQVRDQVVSGLRCQIQLRLENAGLHGETLCQWRQRRKGKGKGSEKNQAARVVLDVTEGLKGCNITCDNFFTSYELAQRLLRERNNTLLGTIKKNKPKLPAALLALRGRPVLSSKFAFTPNTALVSYLPKKNKNVLLLSTLHRQPPDVISQRVDKKPAAILDYNSNKGGMDNLDKVIGTYSCRRMTVRWPLVVFHNILDVSSYNAFVIWRELNPGWISRRRNNNSVL